MANATFAAGFGPKSTLAARGVGIIHALFQNHGLVFFPSPE
jgi:hypothetical protein